MTICFGWDEVSNDSEPDDNKLTLSNQNLVSSYELGQHRGLFAAFPRSTSSGGGPNPYIHLGCHRRGSFAMGQENEE